MATEKETTILEFVIDQDQLLKDAAASKRAIMDVKDAQAALNKEFKKGETSIEEYSEQSVILEKQLKDEQENYNQLTKAIRTNSNSLDAQRLQLSKLVKERNALDKSTEKGIKEFNTLNQRIKDLNETIKKHEQAGGDFRRNVGNYTNSIVDAAKQINVAGVSVGGLSTQLASFANPATAAVGLLTGLTSLYASSTAGALDLENAQNKVSAAFNISANAFGNFVDSLVGGDGQGEGIFSRFVDELLNRINPAIAALANLSADAVRQLKLLELSELTSQKLAKDALKSAEELSRVRDDERFADNERLAAARRVNEFFIEREKELVLIQQQKLEQLEFLLGLDKNNLELQKQIKQIEFEIADIQEDSAGKQTAALEALIRLEQELEDKRKAAAADRRAQQRTFTGPGELPVSEAGAQNDLRIEAEKSAQEAILDINLRFQDRIREENRRFEEQQYNEKVKAQERYTEFLKQQEQQRYAFAVDAFNALSGLFSDAEGVRTAFALSAIAIDTAEAISALTAASEANPLNATTFGGAGIAQYASGIIRILANIASAKELLQGFAEGGYTGPGGKYQPKGIVHAGEVVWSQADVSAMGGPSVVDAMRPTYPSRSHSFGYADGGVVTNTAVAEVNSNLAMMNAFKSMPAPVVSVKEFNRAQRRVEIKENITRLGRR